MGVDINNENGNLLFEYQVRAEISGENCGGLSAAAAVDGNDYNFAETIVISDSRDNWVFTISGDSDGDCDFEFIFEGWQEGLNFNEGFTDRESVFGTIEPLEEARIQEEVFPPDALPEANPDEMAISDYSGEESGEESGDATIETLSGGENFEDNINDDIGEDIYDGDEGADDKNKTETSLSVEDEEKIIAPKQEDLPDGDDPGGDDPDDEKYKKKEDKNGDEDKNENNDQDKDEDGDSGEDKNSGGINKNSVDSVQPPASGQ